MRKELDLSSRLFQHRYVKVGDVYLPNTTAFEKLSQSIRPFGIFDQQPTEYEEFFRHFVRIEGQQFRAGEKFPGVLTRLGSATLLTYKGRYFCIFTRHQLEIAFGANGASDMHKRIFIGMDYDGGTSGLAVQGLLMALQKSDDDLNDIVIAVIFDYFYRPEQRARFFPVQYHSKLPIGTNVIAAGYRYNAKHDITQHALSVYDTTCVSGVISEYHANQKDMYCTLRYENEVRDFDGMSGGAVYAIRLCWPRPPRRHRSCDPHPSGGPLLRQYRSRHPSRRWQGVLPPGGGFHSNPGHQGLCGDQTSLRPSLCRGDYERAPTDPTQPEPGREGPCPRPDAVVFARDVYPVAAMLSRRRASAEYARRATACRRLGAAFAARLRSTGWRTVWRPACAVRCRLSLLPENPPAVRPVCPPPSRRRPPADRSAG